MRKIVTLYIHIPFCASKCNYCSFYSEPGKIQLSTEYFKALNAEIARFQSDLTQYDIVSIYIGGGTPSLVKPSFIDELLGNIKAICHLTRDCEITIETNPESLTKAKLSDYKKAGINRISIGLQAWQDRLLIKLGRSYTSNEFDQIVKLIQSSDIRNFNIDIMFGIPGQSETDWKETIKQALNYQPTHISCYSLELDNSSFWGKLYAKGKLNPVPDESDRKMYWDTVGELISSGYHHYEISNFALKGFECRHNSFFWQGYPYIGIGAGAHSYFDGKHYSNISDIKKYIKMIETDKKHQNIQKESRKDEITDYIMLHFRLLEGINIQDFDARFNCKFNEKYKKGLTGLKQRGLINIKKHSITLTHKGIDLSNQVVMEFL